jgi:predicted dehydrogenase
MFVGLLGSSLTSVLLLGVLTGRANARGATFGVAASIAVLILVQSMEPRPVHGYLSAAVGVLTCVTAHFHQLYVDNDAEDLATVALQLDGGLVGSLCIGGIGAANHPDIGEIKMHILGTKGALVVNEARPEVGVYYRGQPPTQSRNQRLLAMENDDLLADDFARAIDTDANTILDVPTSRAITATVEAALQSG